MALLLMLTRLTWQLALLPSRLLIRWIDRRKGMNGVPPLGTFLRGCVHGFVWLTALMALSMATYDAPPSPPATPVASSPAPRYVPPPVPSGVLEPASSASPVADNEPIYVPLPDADDDDHESRFCRKRWWC